MAKWDDKEYTDEQLLGVIGPFRKVRTSWASLEGQIVHLSLLSKLGFREIDHFLGVPANVEGGIAGRIVGVEDTGLWFECWDHLGSVSKGERTPEEHLHFFVPFHKIAGVKTKAIKREGLNKEEVPVMKAYGSTRSGSKLANWDPSGPG